MSLLTLNDLAVLLRSGDIDPITRARWQEAWPFMTALLAEQHSQPDTSVFDAAAFGWTTAEAAVTRRISYDRDAMQRSAMDVVSELVAAGATLTPRAVAEHCFVLRARQHFAGTTDRS
jgi:hypothetical protein